MKNIRFYASKGGQGVTTIACMTALAASANGQRTALVVDSLDALALMGLPTGSAAYEPAWQVDADDGLVVANHLPDEHFDLVVWDTGYAGMAPDSLTVLVTKRDYLALSRHVASGNHADRVVVVSELGRALTVRDVERALGYEAIEVDYDVTICRMCDAGLMLYRRPEVGRDMAEAILTINNTTGV